MSCLPSLGRSDWLHDDTEILDQTRHLLPEAATAGDDKGFGQRASRYSDVGTVLKHPSTAPPDRFVHQDRDQRGSVDDDQPGSPVSSS